MATRTARIARRQSLSEDNDRADLERLIVTTWKPAERKLNLSGRREKTFDIQRYINEIRRPSPSCTLPLSLLLLNCRIPRVVLRHSLQKAVEGRFHEYINGIPSSTVHSKTERYLKLSECQKDPYADIYDRYRDYRPRSFSLTNYNPASVQELERISPEARAPFPKFDPFVIKKPVRCPGDSLSTSQASSSFRPEQRTNPKPSCGAPSGRVTVTIDLNNLESPHEEFDITDPAQRLRAKQSFAKFLNAALPEETVAPPEYTEALSARVTSHLLPPCVPYHRRVPGDGNVYEEINADVKLTSRLCHLKECFHCCSRKGADTLSTTSSTDISAEEIVGTKRTVPVQTDGGFWTRKRVAISALAFSLSSNVLLVASLILCAYLLTQAASPTVPQKRTIRSSTPTTSIRSSAYVSTKATTPSFTERRSTTTTLAQTGTSSIGTLTPSTSSGIPLTQSGISLTPPGTPSKQTESTWKPTEMNSTSIKTPSKQPETSTSSTEKGTSVVSATMTKANTETVDAATPSTTYFVPDLTSAAAATSAQTVSLEVATSAEWSPSMETSMQEAFGSSTEAVETTTLETTKATTIYIKKPCDVTVSKIFLSIIFDISNYATANNHDKEQNVLDILSAKLNLHPENCPRMSLAGVDDQVTATYGFTGNATELDDAVYDVFSEGDNFIYSPGVALEDYYDRATNKTVDIFPADAVPIVLLYDHWEIADREKAINFMEKLRNLKNPHNVIILIDDETRRNDTVAIVGDQNVNLYTEDDAKTLNWFEDRACEFVDKGPQQSDVCTS